MSTQTLLEATDWGLIQSEAATGADAQDGLGTLTKTDNGNTQAVAQYGSGLGGPLVRLGFLEFNTGQIVAPVTAAVLELWLEERSADTAFDVEVYAFDWGGGALNDADWRDRAWLSAATKLASYSVASGSATPAAYVSFTENASEFADAITAGGTTRLVIASSRHRAGSFPTAFQLEEAVFYTDGAFAKPAKLTVTHAGNVLQGNQPAASGRLRVSQLGLKGAQPAGRGTLGSSVRAPWKWWEERLESGPSDGWVYSQHATYATARSGGGVIESAATLEEFGGGNLFAGQLKFLGGDYICYEAFFRVDTTQLPAVRDLRAATVVVGGTATYQGTDDVLELRAYPAWDGTMTFLAGASVAAATTLVATAPLTNGVAVAAADWTVDLAALESALNYAGFTNFMLVSRRFLQGTAPDNENDFYSALSSENDSGNLGPALSLQFTDVVLAGAQPAASGSLVARMVARYLAGNQPAMSGSIPLIGAPRMSGNQAAAAGVLAVIEDFHPPVVLGVGRAVLSGARLIRGRARAVRPGQ